MKKKFWGIFMILVLCLGLYPVVAQADSGQPWTDVADEAALNAAIADNAQVRLTGNIALTNRLVIPKGQSVTLDLNGNVLSRTSGKDGAVILVQGKLTVKDNAPDTTAHHFRLGSDGLWSWDPSKTAADKIVSGGIITGGKGGTTDPDASSGGGVIVDAIGSAKEPGDPDASFTMLGGSIVGCSSDKGAGVYVSCGTFTMGGSAQIVGCVCNRNDSRQGAGVYVGGGTFIMNDGARIGDCVIWVDNSDKTHQGAGVYVSENKSKTGRFIMNGGTIENCRIDNDSTGQGEGGGVYLAHQGEMTANGGTISGCSSFHGAAIYNAMDSDGILADTSNGGTCFDGTVVNGGQISGGIYYNGEVLNNANGTISGGTFHGTVCNQAGEVYNSQTGYNEPRQGKITDGMFQGNVVNKGIIEGGTFAGSVENLEVSVKINGNDITVTGEIQGGTITGSGSVSGAGAYTVTFMDGYNNNPYYRQAVTTGQKAAAPATAPQRNGYTFKGWYTDAGGTITYDFQTEVTDNLTLYAGWKQNVLPTPGQGGSSGNTGGQGTGNVQVPLEEDHAVWNYFCDVPNDAAYYDAVKWAIKNDLIQTIADIDDGRFRPDAVCTYTQSLAFLRKAMQKMGGSALASGNSRISSYYTQELAQAIAGSMKKRIGRHVFVPHVSRYTRAQIVMLVYHAYQGK